MSLEIFSNSAAETRALGRRLGELSLPGDWIGLTGELGAGKTCLTQGLAQGAGVDERVAVTSPTYVICQSYPGRLPVHHLDLYRLTSPVELAEIGYDEMVYGDGVCVVEWFERIAAARPGFGLSLRLEIIDESKRRIFIEEEGIRGIQLSSKLKQVL
jgi:tRNA threonylcarbamoyladenosine biosynthesis protein TsaE